jgi:hypothetical protein
MLHGLASGVGIALFMMGADGDAEDLESNAAAAEDETAPASATITVSRLDRGLLAVEASCAGCLLTASVEDWTSAAGSSPPVERPSALTHDGADAEQSDKAVLTIVELEGLFAYDVVAWLELASGVVIEQRVTLLGRIDSDNKAHELTWREWVCASPYAACYVNDEGDSIVDLDPRGLER